MNVKIQFMNGEECVVPEGSLIDLQIAIARLETQRRAFGSVRDVDYGSVRLTPEVPVIEEVPVAEDAR